MSNSGIVDTGAERVIRAFERKAEHTEVPDYKARFLNFAGDQCVRAGMNYRAAVLYGRAIDAFLSADRLDAGTAVCRKLVRAMPGIVRARCTLTWLAIAKGLHQDAQREVWEYVKVAESMSAVPLAEQHIRGMVRVSGDPELCWTLADALLWLGDDQGSEQSFAWALSLQNGRPVPVPTHTERWERVRRVLLGTDPVAA